MNCNEVSFLFYLIVYNISQNCLLLNDYQMIDKYTSTSMDER